MAVQIDANNFTHINGTGTEVDFNLVNPRTEVGIDMTDANKTLHAEWEGIDQNNEASTYSRTTATAAHIDWRTQASGLGTWHYLASESFTVGKYKCVYYLKDSADTLTPRPIGECVVTVVAAPGTIP